MASPSSPEATPAGAPILRTIGLTKRYGRLLAVRDVNLEVYPGEVYGFLGPNGSGKSTTIGMILGLVRPSAGRIEVFGLDLRRHYWQIMRRVGAMVEAPAFYPYLSGRDNLRALAQAIGDIPERRIDEVLDLVDLFPRRHDPYKNYSLGMRQRLGIASTLLRDPALIVLDEPTNGLDPAGTKEVRDLIPRLAQQGRAVFLSSHLLHEVEHVCDRVAVLKNGELLAQGPVSILLRRGHGLQVRVDDRQRALQLLRSLSWIPAVHENGAYLLVEVPVEAAAQVTEVLARHNIYLSELRPRDTSLEQFFLDLTAGEKDVAAA